MRPWSARGKALEARCAAKDACRDVATTFKSSARVIRVWPKPLGCGARAVSGEHGHPGVCRWGHNSRGCERGHYNLFPGARPRPPAATARCRQCLRIERHSKPKPLDGWSPGSCGPHRPLCAVGDYVSIIMMLLIARVARGARRHGSGRTTRGDHAEHAAAAGIAVHVLNIGPYMASPGAPGTKPLGWHT